VNQRADFVATEEVTSLSNIIGIKIRQKGQDQRE
jgi:hypothetical protein